MSHEVTEQNNEESKRNEEKNNDIEMEEDYEEDNNIITLNVDKNVIKEQSDIKSVHETFTVVKKILKEQMKVDETFNVGDKHNKRMGTYENWAYGVRTT